MSRRRVRRQCPPDHPGCNANTSTLSPSLTDPTGTQSTTTYPATSTPLAVVASPSTTTSAKSATVAAASSTSNAGTIAGCVIGGVIFLVLVVLGALLYLRARKRNRTPPSSEFMNSIRAGTAPVLRLDSGAEYTPALSEKGGGYTHYPPNIPFMQNSYYTSSPTLNMKFTDEMMVDTPSGRPSVDKPLRPQRYSSQQTDDPFFGKHQPSTSVGSRLELWGSETESPPYTDSILQFAPRFSLNDLSPQPSLPSHSPPPLHPLRRQPDPESSL